MERPSEKIFAATGFVLTGGRSSRMGRDKALLELQGRPMALRTANLAQSVVEEVYLVGDKETHGHLGFPVLADKVAGRGPLAGIVTALENTQHDWSLLLACDLPFLEGNVLRALLACANSGEAIDAVVPRTEDGWQPLCAVYHRRCLPVFQEVLESDKPKIALAFNQLRVHTPGADNREEFAFPERMFKNMNSPEDFDETKRTLGP
jgi:molybdopterin-guanine dinucleotide biosynthesis protein A